MARSEEIGWLRVRRAARISACGCVLLLVLSACQTAAKPPVAYNPLNQTDGADPWMQYYEGNYYLTATQWGSIRMWKSPTLAGLADAKPVTIWSDSTPSRCCNVWAPEFHLLDGPNGPRWYVYYTAGADGTLDNQRMHVLESSGTDPLGPYTYKAQIGDPTNNGWAIDGSVLKMPDSTLYFLFSSWDGPNQNLYIAPMRDPWTISGGRVLLSTPTYDWEKKLGNVNEGPVALQRDGKIFIIYSASACWGPDYKLGMLTYNGGDVLSTASWVKQAQPVFQRSDENGVYGPGHNGFFTSPDGRENWIVYHANAAASDGCTGSRTTRVQKFTWNADGTPNFGTPQAIDTPITVPSGERGSAPPGNPVFYKLISKNSGQCLDAPGADAAPVQQISCSDAASQQWAVEYLGNGYSRLINQASGKALETAGGPDATQEAAAIQQGNWSHSANQEWRLMPTIDGWLRIEARHSSKAITIGGCAANTATFVQQATWQNGNNCQQFRLQPVKAVKLVNANSTKPLTVENAATADGAPVVLGSDTGAAEQQWKFVHQDSGYYQIVASHSGKCLEILDGATNDGAKIDQRTCSSAANQQWRIDPLNDGSVRLIARHSRKVVDSANCRMGDGTALQQWTWLNNPCQRIRLAAP